MNNSNYNSIIWLTQDKYTIVDNEDYQHLIKWKWQFRRTPNSHNGYADRHEYIGKIDNKYQTYRVHMHRELIEVPSNMFVDHINRDSLDNRKENLRVCTIGENARNARPRSDNTSGYKGVSWHKRDKKWTANISYKENNNIIRVSLGYHNTKDEAAIAYNKAAQKYHGEFAYINSVSPTL